MPSSFSPIFPILEILFDFIFLLFKCHSYLPAAAPPSAQSPAFPPVLSQPARPNMAKPTINTEHAFLINTSWHEKELGIAEGNKQDYCMGWVDQETSEEESGS
jgi:hypothetical protein